MKFIRTVFFLTFIFFVTCPIIVFSDTIGIVSPTMKKGNVNVGFEVSSITKNFDLKNDFEIDMNRFLLKCEYALNNWSSVYVKVGMNDVSSQNYFIDASSSDIETNFGFTTAVGYKRKIYEKNNVVFGITFQMMSYAMDGDDITPDMYYNPTKDRYYGFGVNNMDIDGTEIELCIGGTTKPYENLDLYGGLLLSVNTLNISYEFQAEKYEDVRDHVITEDVYNQYLSFVNFTNYTKKIEGNTTNNDYIGLVLGGRITLLGNFEGGLEARLINEKSFALYGSYIF